MKHTPLHYDLISFFSVVSSKRDPEDCVHSADSAPLNVCLFALRSPSLTPPSEPFDSPFYMHAIWKPDCTLFLDPFLGALLRSWNPANYPEAAWAGGLIVTRVQPHITARRRPSSAAYSAQDLSSSWRQILCYVISIMAAYLCQQGALLEQQNVEGASQYGICVRRR